MSDTLLRAIETHWQGATLQYVAGWASTQGKDQVFSIITKPMLDSSHHHSPVGPSLGLFVHCGKKKKDFFFSEHHPVKEEVLFIDTISSHHFRRLSPSNKAVSSHLQCKNVFLHNPHSLVAIDRLHQQNHGRTCLYRSCYGR